MFSTTSFLIILPSGLSVSRGLTGTIVVRVSPVEWQPKRPAFPAYNFNSWAGVRLLRNQARQWFENFVLRNST